MHPPETHPAPDDLDRLAATGKAWDLLAACHRRLGANPDDPDAQKHRRVVLDALGIRAESPLPSSRLEQVALTNLRALGLQEDNEETVSWIEQVRQGHRRFFTASDGNTLLRVGDAPVAIEDARAGCESALASLPRPGPMPNVADFPGVLVLEPQGVPWIIRGVLERVARGVHGYKPRIYIVGSHGADRLLDALAVVDLSEELTRASTRVLLGPDAPSALEHELQSLWRCSLPADVLSHRPSQDVVAAVSSARAHQQRRMSEAHAICAERSKCTNASWSDRFASAGPEDPLRVLLVTTRYTTYVKHSMAALARAIERAGAQARLLLEEAPDLLPAATHELSAHAEFDPDIAITANWPRSTRPQAWPEGAPGVCWLQDTLGSMLTPQAGHAQGPLDFMAGLVNKALFQDFAFPRERAVFLTTPACPETFTPPTSAPAQAVDVAYVSQQSEPYDALVNRMLGLFTNEGERAIVRTLAQSIRASIARGEAMTYARAHECAAEAVDAAGTVGRAAQAPPAAMSRLVQVFALPFAERAVRHQTVAWASEICKRHGLTFALFGRGWESTPFAEHARGELDHAAGLRDIYAGAACHLHASAQSNAHQRVFECALSGGLMLRKGPSPDLPALVLESERRLAINEPTFENEGFHGYFVSLASTPEHPDSPGFDPIRYANLVGQPAREPYPHPQEGYPIRPFWINRTAVLEDTRSGIDLPLEQFPDWAYDRPRDTLFADRDELESSILRAVSDPEWRRETIAHHRQRALEFNTTDVFWSRLVGAVRRGLSQSPSPANV